MFLFLAHFVLPSGRVLQLYPSYWYFYLGSSIFNFPKFFLVLESFLLFAPCSILWSLYLLSYLQRTWGKVLRVFFYSLHCLCFIRDLPFCSFGLRLLLVYKCDTLNCCVHEWDLSTDGSSRKANRWRCSFFTGGRVRWGEFPFTAEFGDLSSDASVRQVPSCLWLCVGWEVGGWAVLKPSWQQSCGDSPLKMPMSTNSPEACASPPPLPQRLQVGLTSLSQASLVPWDRQGDRVSGWGVPWLHEL